MKTKSSGKKTKKAAKKTRFKPKTKAAKLAAGSAGAPAKRKAIPSSEEIMDRATLKAIVGQLKGAGSSVKALKSDTDEALQKKVNDALRQLPSAAVVKKLESIDPDKLVKVLKRDCLGIFVDFSDVSCVRCSDASKCVSEFVKNLEGGMSVVDGVVASDVKEAAKPASPAVKLTPVTRYEPKRVVFVRDVKNPNPEGDDLHDTIQRVLDDQPETLGELRTIVEQDFDLDGDADFMKFVTAMRDSKEGVIKLDVDLTDDDKAALRKAGYEI